MEGKEKNLPYDNVLYYLEEWNLAIVSLDGNYGYINKHGEEIILL